MNTGIIVIIIAVLLIIPIQMILPFPYGLGMSIFLIILGIVLAKRSRSDHKRREKFAEDNLKYSDSKDEPKESKKDDMEWEGI